MEDNISRGDSAADLNRSYYDQRFGTSPRELSEEEIIRWRAIEQAIKQLNLPPQCRIADFGCGRGWISDKLTAFGNVTAFDVSPKAIENARRVYPHIDFRCLDAAGRIDEELRYSFDLVVSSEVIEHINDQRGYVNNIGFLLKSQAALLLTTPNGRWQKYFFNRNRQHWRQPIENWMRDERLLHLCNSAGIRGENLSTFNSEWIYDIRPRLWVSVLALPLFRKIQKALRLYPLIIRALNNNKMGLNYLLIGRKV